MKKFLVLVSLLITACSVQDARNIGDFRLRGIANGTKVPRAEGKLFGAVLGLQIGRGICTGTHVGGKFILTAWHCIGMAIARNGGAPVPFTVVSPAGPVAFEISENAYRVHYPKAEDYILMGDGSGGKIKVPQPDVALIEIKAAPEEFLAIPNAKIASTSADDVTGKFTIAGYGVNSFSKELGTSGELFKAPAEIKKSDSIFHYLIWIEGWGTGSAMPGDSGGPLMVFSNGVPVVYGVLSGGVEINEKGEQVEKGQATAVAMNRYSRLDTSTMRDFFVSTMKLR